MKQIIRILLSCMLCLCTFLSTTQIIYAQDPNVETANTSDMMTGGYIEGDLDKDTPVHDGIATYANLPTNYQSNIDEINQLYPSVRNQNPYGTCWSFATLGLAEFDLIHKGQANNTIDLSELQLAYFLYNSALDPLNGTDGDQAKYYNENASTNYLNYGGNYEMAARRLSQWSGATNESLVPYENAGNVLSNGLDTSYAYNYDVATLQNAYVINMKQNVQDVKENIIEHGAAGVMYYHNDTSMVWNSEKQIWTYYASQSSGGSHAVMIVGWDDNFSKDNFVGNEKPLNDGAWLIRNSWGSYISYFWMSYENASLMSSAWFMDFSSGQLFDNNYQYDGGLLTYSSNLMTGSNVFDVQSKTNNESLKAVNVSFSHTADVNYSIDVYTDLKDKNNPYSGIKQEEATTTGYTSYAGIYTIALKNPVTLKPNSSYAIVVTTNKNSLDHEEGILYAQDMNASKPTWDTTVKNNGRSFYEVNGKFITYAPGNLCIKALTLNTQTISSYKIEYELNGGVNNSNNPESYTEGNSEITLQNPTRDGYMFEGWYLDEGFTQSINAIPANSNHDYKLYAKWKEEIKTIDISNVKVDGIPDQMYTGSSITPKVTIQGLKEHEDYYLDYKNNKEVGTASIVIHGKNKYTGTKTITFKIIKNIKADIMYRTHVQTYGWQSWKKNGEMSGTSGESKRLEGINIKLSDDLSGNIEYQTHVQTYGWQGWKKNGEMSGTSGESKRLEGIKIRLTGEVANQYDVYYRVHAQTFGWLGWAKNGECAGSEGYSKRLEGIQIVLVKKGSNAPGSTERPFVCKMVKYQTHVQTYGWQAEKSDGETSGTTGQSKRLESINVKLSDSIDGGIQYKTHVQTYGWQNWVTNGQNSGTTGQSKRLEAIQIQLTGNAANEYDIYYRVHAQHFGWLGWAKNGQSAGTSGYSYRLEGIQIVLVKKGQAAPSSTSNVYYKH